MFDAIVIGAGIHGLSAAYHLRRLGVARVCVVERFRLGHDRGSSHGASRITRSAYANRLYVDLVAAANAEEWPRLEHDARETLVTRRKGCFFGPSGGPIAGVARAVTDAGADVVAIDHAEASRSFPALRFDAGDLVLDDRTAGLIAAERTMNALARLCAASGVTILEEKQVSAIHLHHTHIAVACGAEDLVCDRLVVAAGPWAGDLVPIVKPKLTVLRQTVGFFDVRGARDLPVWAHFGANDLHYGLPQLGRPGAKLAFHRVAGMADDPDAPSEPSQPALKELHEFVAQHFVHTDPLLIGAETCFFTMAPNEDYVIDLLPNDPRVAIGCGFSGHGFKLGPLTGRVLAELAIHGKSTVPAFESHRATWGLQR